MISRQVLRVGLTGGIGSGKSTVTELLRERGALVVDADLLAREAVAPGSDGLSEVVAAFGTTVLRSDGSLDRAALGRLVFTDPAARHRLEEIVHPRVRSRADELEAAAPVGSVVVHDIPLLVESGQADGYDVVVVVDLPPEVQIARLVAARRMTEADARARIKAQASREERLAAADVVLDNSGSLHDLRAQIDGLWSDLDERARNRTTSQDV